ncbi:MAG: DEAD/DEAH box helicase [Micrococcales bacterium]|nr:DEAD/DEAH box helicase [Micrococcales bacterium]
MTTEPSPADSYAASRRRARAPRLSEFARLLDFGLDDFQVEACQALEGGRGVLVAAPTGAGKTVVGEFAVHLGLAAGSKTFYTTPIKALSNQKYADLVRRHGAERVGLLTGDTTINGEAPVVVMTTEVLRNMLYQGSDLLDGLGHVVMDEVHYLADRSRGAVWEEVIIHLPDRVVLVSLSATVSNAEELGDWLTSVRGDTAVVVSERRPVPLGQHVLVSGRLHDLYARHVDPTAPGTNPPINPETAAALRRLDLPGGGRGGPRQRGRREGTDRRSAGRGPRGPITPTRLMVELLDQAGMLPAIVFIFSRAGCQAAVERCVASGLLLTTAAERAQIEAVVEQRCAVIDSADLTTLGYDGFVEALTRGVAAHHAGLLPVFKETVEDLFAAGLVKVVFATETLALGINMPARAVVLDQLVKWDGQALADLTPGEYTQLTGRAGRRGIDTEGHAVVLGRPGLDPVHLAGLASRRLYPLRSSFAPTYNMAVNLVAGVGRERAREVLEMSFAQHQADRAVVAQARALRTATRTLEEVTVQMTCHLGDIVAYDDLRRRLSEAEKGKRGSRAQDDRQRPGPGRDRVVRDRPVRDRLAEEKIAALRRRLKAHPCHACPDRDKHLRLGVRRARLIAEKETLTRKIAGQAGTVAARFDTVCEVLVQLGYLVASQEPGGLRPTATGRWLRRIYTEKDLLAAQCLRGRVLSGLDPAGLAAVVSALVYRSRRDEQGEARTPRTSDETLLRALDGLARAWRTVADQEQAHGLPVTPAPDLGLVDAVHRWASGRSLAVALRSAELEAGDFVRWVKQVIDLLGQMAQAAPDAAVRSTASRAVEVLRRGVVDNPPPHLRTTLRHAEDTLDN